MSKIISFKIFYLVLDNKYLNPIQYGLFLKHYGMGGGPLWPPL